MVQCRSGVKKFMNNMYEDRENAMFHKKAVKCTFSKKVKFFFCPSGEQ